MLQNTFFREAGTIQQHLVQHRRWLHAHAETGFSLRETKAYVKAQLENMGYSVQECGKAGLSATAGKPGGKVILLRADMDALPIPEETGLPYACTHSTMHACGHDLHTTMLLGAAQLLKTHEKDLAGQVKFMFQPAEEIFEGSLDMIQHGILENPRPDAAMMIHVSAGIPLPAGTVIVSSPGVSAPAADYFTIRVQGKGCHGSAPQNGVDPLTAAAHILIALQEILSREISSSQEAVVTIGSFHGGEAGNAIPDSAVLQGTIRSYDEHTRGFLKQRLTEISQGIAASFRASAAVTFGSSCPTLVNDQALSESVTGILKELLGDQAVFTTAQLGGGKPQRGGGSEDFAYITQEIPSVMLALAAGEPAKGHCHPLHHPKVTFEEGILSTGAAIFAGTAYAWLKQSKDIPSIKHSP